jgi:hypothetical protein
VTRGEKENNSISSFGSCGGCLLSPPQAKVRLVPTPSCYLCFILSLILTRYPSCQSDGPIGAFVFLAVHILCRFWFCGKWMGNILEGKSFTTWPSLAAWSCRWILHPDGEWREYVNGVYILLLLGLTDANLLNSKSTAHFLPAKESLSMSFCLRSPIILCYRIQKQTEG